MATVQGLLDQLNASQAGGTQWKIFGNGVPIEETGPVTQPADASTGTPAQTVNRGTGRYYVTIQDNEGHQRAMFLKADPIKGGSVVLQSGVNETVPDTTPDAKGHVDPAKTKPNPDLYTGSLTSLSWGSGGPIGDVPQGAKQPTASGELDSLNSKGQVIPPGTSVDPNNPDTKPVQMRDPKTGTVFNTVTDPAGALHDVGDEVWLVKADGTHTVVGSKPTKPDTMNVPGVGLVEYDPTKPEGSRTSVVMPVPTDVNNLGGIQVRNGKSYVPTRGSDGKITFVEANLPAEQEIGYHYDSPDSKWIVFYDKQGQEISRTEKPDWKPAINVQPGTAPAADLVSAKIPQFNPQTGALEFVDNPNQIKASEATSELAKQLGLKVAAGSMSEKQAQDLITASINTMNAQSQAAQAQAQQAQVAGTAAGDILRNTQQGATTAAGLLQQRAQAATGTLQSILGNTLGNKNITSYAPDTAANLVQGLSGWTASLMGGQATMDSAARMVQMADPKSSLADPSTQTAIGTLTQMLDKYRQLTGGPHPIEQATQAAQQSQQQGGITAPNTGQATQAVQPVQAVQAVGTGFTPPGYGAGTAPTYPTNPWTGATPQMLPTQAANLAGAGVGGGFHAPTIVINAGGG